MVLSPTSGFPSHHTPTVWYTASGNNGSATHVGNWKPEPRGLEFKMFRATALEDGTSELTLNGQVKGETNPD